MHGIVVMTPGRSRSDFNTCGVEPEFAFFLLSHLPAEALAGRSTEQTLTRSDFNTCGVEPELAFFLLSNLPAEALAGQSTEQTLTRSDFNTCGVKLGYIR